MGIWVYTSKDPIYRYDSSVETLHGNLQQGFREFLAIAQACIQSLRHVSSPRLTWMKWRRHLDTIPTNTLLFCTIRLRRPALQQQQKVNDSNLLICPARKISCNRTGSRTSKLRLEWYPCYATHLHKWSSASSQKAPLIVVNLSCIASSHIPKSMFAASILLKVADARRQPAYLQPI
jgi:hypothetical protein